MIILRGEYAGQSLTPHQFANDWISAKENAAVFRPTSVRLEEADRPMFEQRDPREVGTFWGEWRLNGDGTFTGIQAVASRADRRARLRQLKGRGRR